MYRIYLDHGEAYGNLGDEAMLINAARRIRKRLGEVEFVVPHQAGAPLPDIGPRVDITPPGRIVKQFASRIVPLARLRTWLDRRSINPFPRFIMKVMISTDGVGSWRRLVDKLRRCDAVYCVGAANLNDFARYGCLLPKCMLIEQAYTLGIPVIVSSQTVGPLELPWTQQVVVRAVNRSTFFSLRDGGVSEKLLVSLGIDSARLFSIGDEAFSLPPSSEDTARRYLTEQGIDPTRPFALFHFRATDYTQSTAKYYTQLAQALDKAQVESQILFVPMSYWHHSGRDEECGEAIRQLMAQPEKLHILRPTRDVRLIRRLVDMSNWVMALSYHLQVFALAAACSMGIISSGAYYQVKAQGMQMMVGSEIPFVDLDQATVDELVTAIQYLEEEHNACVSILEQARAKVKQNNDAPVEALAQTLAAKRHLL